MIVPDINLLLYAYDSESPFHAQAQTWWETHLSGTEPIGLTHVVVFGFLRVATSARAFRRPMTAGEATRHVRSWFAQPVVRSLDVGPQDLEAVLILVDAVGTAGNLVTDAQIAAAALAHGAVVHSNDTDFARFPGLRWFNPIAGTGSRPVRRRT